MFYSPLRYPWWKNRLATFIAKICVDNKINGHYIEPYAWWASVALYLLIEKKINHITINDYDRSIYAIRHSILKNTNKFCKLIENTEITIENRHKAKEIQKNKKKAKLLDLWFATFFLNRTNISGIINAWVIGGVKQNGKYKIDCRFNKKDLIKRIKVISKHKKQITLTNRDALDIIKDLNLNENKWNSIIYLDPPYYQKWSSLYMNHYTHEQHIDISNAMKELTDVKWIISYDNTNQIEDIYNRVDEDNTTKYSFNHSAYRAKKWKEILFFWKNMRIPLNILEEKASIIIE